MPLGAREMLLAIEARDNASAAIRGVGTAVTGLGGQSRVAGYQIFAMGLALQKAGSMLMSFGKAIFGVASEVARLGIEFDASMRLVQTQARLGTTQLERFTDAANDVMAKVPSASSEVAEGLYDIFSSIKVNYRDALDMVTSFSRAAVAGNTDVRTVTRGVIQIMNAFGLEAKDTRSILDLLFKQVQQSTGTFEELVSAWGNVVSAAKSMDQKLFTTAGAVDFLTKRGRTQAQATISVSRALDQLSRHYQDVQKVLGVEVFDKATGNFRQLNDIINDMGVAMEGMTTEEQVSAFEDMFGAGSIQANRFFRLAVPQFKTLNAEVENMTKQDIKGFFKGAWDTMRDTPAVQMAILQNRVESLGRDLRDFFLPALLQIVQVGKKVIDWVRGWDDGTKKMVATIVLIVGALALFFGAIAKIGGGILLFTSLLRFAGIGVTTFIGTLGGLGLVGGVIVAALVGAIVLIVTHWEEFTDFWERNWDTIKHVAVFAIGAIIVVMAQLGRALAINIGAKLINLVVSFQAAGGAAGAFKTVLSGLGRVVNTIAWAALVGWLIEIWNGFQKVHEVAEKTFKTLSQKGPAAIDNVTRSIDKQLGIVQESHDHWWNFLAVWRAPEWASQAATLDGLTQGLERYRTKIWEATGFTDEYGSRIQYLEENTGQLDNITLKEAQSIGVLLGMYNRLHGPMDQTTIDAVANLLAMGDVEAVYRLLLPDIQKMFRGLKNLQSPMERHNELLGDQAAKLAHAAAEQKALNQAQNAGLGALRNLLTPEERHNELLGDMAAKLAHAAGSQRQLNGAMNGGLGALRNLLTPAQRYAEAMGDMAAKLAHAAGAQLALNSAANAFVPPNTGGGNNTPTETGGGAGSGHGRPTGNPVKTYPDPSHARRGGQGDINVFVTPRKATIDAKDLADEIDWAMRGARWM